MKLFIQIVPLSLLLFFNTGCGGTAGESRTETTQNIQSYDKGAIALWDYLVPETDTTNSYIKTSGDQIEKYRTHYTREADTVTEISEFSKNEKTIYTKTKNNITILFYTDNVENGRLELKPTVDIGDIVTIKKSDCTLVKKWDNFRFEEQSFDDVIEIQCGNTPGYYQRGTGEILQKRALSQNGTTVETKLIASDT